VALIKREDVDAVRERARIDEVVGAHVTLKPAGVGSLKGLCPFHDERSASFHVRPQVGRWHCFGCNEGGDVISFVQKIDGLGFTEAVEYLAERFGVQLRYEDGGGPRRSGEPGQRHRLMEAHRVAAQFYAEQLFTPGAGAARTFLAERSFDRAAAEHFGVGYAPTGWDALLKHLRGRGFTEAELTASGLVSQGNRGIYDRFRGRLVWPIRDVTGETIGFGARKLYDPRRPSTRSRRCSTAWTWPSGRSPRPSGSSSSRGTPTSWRPTCPA
jgi:DNA primase